MKTQAMTNKTHEKTKPLPSSHLNGWAKLHASPSNGGDLRQDGRKRCLGERSESRVYIQLPWWFGSFGRSEETQERHLAVCWLVWWSIRDEGARTSSIKLLSQFFGAQITYHIYHHISILFHCSRCQPGPTQGDNNPQLKMNNMYGSFVKGNISWRGRAHFYLKALFSLLQDWRHYKQWFA